MAVISGGAEVTRGLLRNITLNASLSYDPEVAHGNRLGMKFTWHYGKVAGNPSSKKTEAKVEKDVFTAVNESAIHYYGKASGEQISLNAKALSVNQTYIVKLVVTKDRRISTVYQVIHLIEGDPPEIYQRLGIYFVCFCCYLVCLVCFTVGFVAVVNTYICSWPCYFSLFSLMMLLSSNVLFLILLFFVVSASVVLCTLLLLLMIMLFSLSLWLLLLL